MCVCVALNLSSSQIQFALYDRGQIPDNSKYINRYKSFMGMMKESTPSERIRKIKGKTKERKRFNFMYSTGNI